jgi:hypothetical protein
MADFVRYEPAASRCSGKAQPGCEAFADWAVRDFGRGAFNLGIYNCRSVRGSANRSIHGDGRAVDVGFKMVNGRANPAGWVLLNQLLPHVSQLGIQMIIWDRRIWSARTPNGAAYTGTASHRDHLHVEFNWNAARTLTRDRVRRVMAGSSVVQPPRPAPKPAPIPTRPTTPPPQPADPQLEDDDMATYIRLNLKKGAHAHAGRVEAVTAMHRRWVPANELQHVSFLGEKIVSCNRDQFNAWTSNKAAVGANGITGPI